MAKVFFSYAHEDEGLLDELRKHLAPLRREGLIEAWHDRCIKPGADIHNEISQALEQADVVVLLVSPDFLNSDYCYDVEMRHALERHEAGAARVIPVILRPCDWHGMPFGRLNATPMDGQAVTRDPNHDEAFLQVALSVRQAIQSLKSPAKPGQSQEDAAAASAEQAPRPPPDPGRLRVRREFSDRDRHRFQEDAFEAIARHFEQTLQDLEARNPEIETSFRRIDANRFEAVAYVHGKERSRCGIWLDGGSSLMDGIFFSYGGVGSGKSYNESMSVSDDGFSLFLEPTGMAHIGRERATKLTHEEGGQYYWGLFMDNLR